MNVSQVRTKTVNVVLVSFGAQVYDLIQKEA